MATPGVVDGMRNVRPPITIYPPSTLPHFFSTFSLDHQVQNKYAHEIETLKKEARMMLMNATTTKLLIIVDTIERLGLAYHFQTEIEQRLQEIYNEDDADDYDLFFTSLRFRLLRQHQYPVSCNEFDKFKDKNGKFQEGLISDVEGLLSLYEAAYVQINGEGILEEAVRESKSGKMLTAVDCYMKQHGVSKQIALAKFAQVIEDEWKNLNAVLATTTACLPREIVELFLNYARMAETAYETNEDTYSYQDYATGYLKALFVESLLI